MKNRGRRFLSLLGVLLFAASCGSGSGTTAGNASNNNAGGSSTGQSPKLQSCQVFPPDNPWNLDVSKASLHPNSQKFIDYILAHGAQNVHPDFGSNLDFGIPYALVPGTQAKVPIQFDEEEQSDPGPYPIPPNAPVEAGGDAHVLIIDQDNCKLYEMDEAQFNNPGWSCFSGAIFDLNSNALRPDTFTSADAAGLPIFPGLVRFDEAVTQGEIKHALRFTVDVTQNGFIHPATHQASDVTDAFAPPMGLRLRLKEGYDISGFTGTSRVVLTALKKYGMILADNGGNWYISGATDSRWNDDDLEQLKSVPGSAFEVVDTGPILH